MPPTLSAPWLSSSAEPFSSLKQGACGPEAEYLQCQLQAAGFLQGPADGLFDARTKAAVMAFQRARGLEVDGVCGPRTWAALDSRRGTGLRPTLKRGATEPAVRVLQKVLAAHGFECGGEDGHFGPRTERAVLAFQRARGLEADGIAGPRTWSALGKTAPQALPALAGAVEGLLSSAWPGSAPSRSFS